MTAQAPSAAEQTTIDRLGIFDEEKFAEIVEHVDERPTCEVRSRSKGGEWGLLATHLGVCRVCGRNALLLCGRHAEHFSTRQQMTTHVPCGSSGTWAELLRVVEL